MTRPDPAPIRAAILSAFGQQIGWCERLGSPLTAEVLTLLAQDIGGGGAGASLVDAWPGDPAADALPLRLAGALHHGDAWDRRSGERVRARHLARLE